MPNSAPPIRVNATPATISVDRPALTALPPGAPVAVMIHGYRFAPGAEGPNCPHRHIFSLDPPRNDRKAISWPASATGRATCVPALCRAFIDSRIALASLRPSLPERMQRRWSRLFWPAQSLPFLSQTQDRHLVPG